MTETPFTVHDGGGEGGPAPATPLVNPEPVTFAEAYRDFVADLNRLCMVANWLMEHIDGEDAA